MMPIEREIKSKVDELLTSMASGDSLALGCKTALRNLIKYKRDVVEKTQRQPKKESSCGAGSSREMEVEFLTLALAIHVLDGVWSGGPSRYPPGWEQKRKVGELAKRLEELERQPVSSNSEPKDYPASIIYRAVFFADGLKLLDQWEKDRNQVSRLVKKTEKLDQEKEVLAKRTHKLCEESKKYRRRAKFCQACEQDLESVK